LIGYKTLLEDNITIGDEKKIPEVSRYHVYNISKEAL
jgi:hypothetical protein